MTNKKAAPVEEQQISSPNDTTTNLADAIRLSCYANRIDHDVAESIVGGVFARYRPKPDFESIIHTVEPEASTPSGDAVNSLWVARDGKYLKFISADESGKPNLESIIRSVEPEASTQRFLSVYEPWPRHRTLAEAQKVAAAIVAEYGGSVETMRFSTSPKEGCVKVTACDTEISIYFQDEEVSQ